MLWWFVGFWLASPVLLPIVWLLGNLRGAPQENPRRPPPLSFAEASPGLSLAVCRKHNIRSVSADRDIGASDDAKRP